MGSDLVFRHLPDALIREVHGAAVTLSLAVGAQDALLAGLPARFVAGLAVRSRPDARLLEALFALNGIERLADGSVPLEVWLRNAALLSPSREESKVFERALGALRIEPGGQGAEPRKKAPAWQ
jgi:endonuclease G